MATDEQDIPQQPDPLQEAADRIMQTPLVQDTILPFMQEKGFLEEAPRVQVSRFDGNAVKAQAFPEEGRISIAADADMTLEELENVILHELGHFLPEGRKQGKGEKAADNFRDALRILRGDPDVEFSAGLGKTLREFQDFLRERG